LHEKQYARTVKSFAAASEIFTHAVSARRRPQNCFLGVYLSGGQKDGSRRVRNRDCREI
jgi:hypothetical protein